MKIIKYSLHNFKAFRKLDLNMKRLNFLFGPNSAGKSTIIQSLLLLKQSLEGNNDSGLIFNGKYIDLGSGKNVLNNNSLEPIGFDFELLSEDNFLRTLEEQCMVKYSSKLRFFVRRVNEHFGRKSSLDSETTIDLRRMIQGISIYQNGIDPDDFYHTHEKIQGKITELMEYLNKHINEYIQPLLIEGSSVKGNSENSMKNNFDPKLLQEYYYLQEGLVKPFIEDLDKLFQDFEEMHSLGIKIMNGKLLAEYKIDPSGRCNSFTLTCINKNQKTLLLNLGFKTWRELPKISSDYFQGLESTYMKREIKNGLQIRGILYFLYEKTSGSPTIGSNGILAKTVNNVSHTILTFLSDLNYSTPVRVTPERHSTKNNYFSSNSIEHSGKDLIYQLNADEELMHFIQKWGTYFELFESIAVKSRSILRQYDLTNRGVTHLTLLDVGFGVSQVLPVIAVLWKATKGSTVLMEQPEIHLHPRLQALLMDMFIAVSREKNLQLIIETHSDYLIRRLQRRLAEFNNTQVKKDAKKIDLSIEPNEIGLYSIRYQKESDSSVSEEILVDQNTFQFTYPEGFLPEEDDRLVYLQNIQKNN